MTGRKMMGWNFRNAVLGLSSVLALVTVSAPRAEDVKVFDRPPSVEEMRSALGIKDGSKPMMRTRSIQIDEPGEPAAPATAAAAPAPATYGQPSAAPVAQTKPPRHKPAASASASNVSVSDKAIAMKITFATGSTVITPESEGYVSSVAQLLAAEPKARLVIEGHTDAAGQYNSNMSLSRGRAMAVRNALMQRYGISSSRLIAIGKGPTELLVPNDPMNAENRRVQFRLRG